LPKPLAVIGLAMALSLPAILQAATPTESVRETVDNILAILKDPALKGEQKKKERREKLKEVIYRRFDFTEMAKRSLGSEWRRHSPEEQKEFVQLFRELLENSYLDKIESYNGQEVRYLKERVDNNYAEVDTKLVDNKGQEFSIVYRLYNTGGDWKVYDVVIEDISLVNNYRAQFSRVLAKSSYAELVDRMKKKQISAPGKNS
jgi:phospholipid transport system substrate-binding protein